MGFAWSWADYPRAFRADDGAAVVLSRGTDIKAPFGARGQKDTVKEFITLLR